MSLVEKNKELLKKAGKKRSKYGSKKVLVQGILFDSIKEGNRYAFLKILIKRRIISQLELQPVYELNPGGTFSYKYKADFKYYHNINQEWIIEDVKGFRTPTFKKKAKLMLKVHKIKIIEI